MHRSARPICCVAAVCGKSQGMCSALEPGIERRRQFFMNLRLQRNEDDVFYGRRDKAAWQAAEALFFFLLVQLSKPGFFQHARLSLNCATGTKCAFNTRLRKSRPCRCFM